MRRAKRMRGALSWVAVALAASVAAGCTWVKPTEKAGGVRVARADQVQTCKKLGRTTSKVAARVLFFQRGEKKVAGETETLARNEAAEMGGDTIVAATLVADGRQAFDIYHCGW
jgi:hypothetical protein